MRRQFRAAQFCEGAVGRHEAHQHGADQLCRLHHSLAGLSAKRVAITRTLCTMHVSHAREVWCAGCKTPWQRRKGECLPEIVLQIALHSLI